MVFDHPKTEQIPLLRVLWKEAFGDTENFLDNFFNIAFDSKRCLCATAGCEVAAMAYWFDCEEYAYIYAVATAEDHRGRGICHALMGEIHDLLTRQGYTGCLVVPGEESLRDFYRSMGYENCGGVQEFDCEAGAPLPLRKLTTKEYAALRRQYLPEGGVVQEGVNLNFLGCWAEFYKGENFLAAAMREDGQLRILELLGGECAAPGIVAALGAQIATFRIPGTTPFAMYRALNSGTAPKYFGFCF